VAIEQTLLASSVLIRELLVVDAKLTKDCCLIVIRRDDIFHCLVAELVGLVEGHSAAKSATGEPNTKTLAVVIPADLPVEIPFGNRQSPDLPPSERRWNRADL
jgi:hypothetical protein